MTSINLLPWRELKREQEKKWFGTLMAITAVSAVLIVVLLNYYSRSLIESQQKRNQILSEEIHRFDLQIKQIKQLKQLRQALISRMMIVENLQFSRLLTVHLFDELIKIMPKGLTLTALERNQQAITITGYAESNSDISELMRTVEKNPWVRNPQLTEIKTPSDEKIKENQFKLHFFLKQKHEKTGAMHE